MRTFIQKPKASQRTSSAKSTVPKSGTSWTSREVNSILHLQRPIGNQAVLRMMQTDTQEPESALSGLASPRFGYDFSRIPIHPPAAGATQTKLAINKLGDSYEQEADRLAEQVMRTPESQLHRACPCGGGCPKCHSEQPDREPESLQTKHVQASDTGQTAAPPIVHEVLRSPGQPLDLATRAFMEPRFGYDFSRVRVHDDGAAAQSARDVSADAYTVGHDIVFGAGQFAPRMHRGKRLLAHELTHVTQQNGRRAGVQRTPADDKRERRNEATARQSGQAMAARIKKEGKLSEEARAQMARDLGFFEGPAWERYVRTVRPTLLSVIEIDMSEEGGALDEMRQLAPGWAELASEFSQTFLPVAQGGRELLTGGRIEEPEEPEVIKARKEFRAHHGGHGQQVLDNIDMSLKRVTSNNPTLLVVYYRYYAEHELTDSLPYNMPEEKYAGATAGGDTDINPQVLSYKSRFPTDSAISLLGGTLIHEFSHTPQDNPLNPLFEAKAYGIEWYFAERSGDQARVDFIERRHRKDSREIRKMLYFSYYTMGELYKTIDEGGPAAQEARDMSVEYISKNADNYRPKLKAIFLEVSQFYVP